jgi:hypothetical protein
MSKLMNLEHAPVLEEASVDSRSKHKIKIFGFDMPELVTVVTLLGTFLNCGLFFLFLMFEAIAGPPEPTNWLTKIVRTHYAAVVGIPLSAVTAFCIVSLLKVTNKEIELRFGNKLANAEFHGPTGQTILWILCFLAVVIAFHLVWFDVALL